MRCAVCGSERLSPLGTLRVEAGRYGKIWLLFKRPGILKPRPMYAAYLARACRDCGALIPFIGEEQRRSLDADSDNLLPADDY